MRAIWAMLSRAFGWPAADFARWASGPPRERVLAAFVDDEPVACARVREFGQWFGGRRVPLGGFSPVGVAAEFRGRGLGSLITTSQYPLLRERGEVLAGLYPATNALYRKVGFELSGVWAMHKTRTREAATPPARARHADATRHRSRLPRDRGVLRAGRAQPSRLLGSRPQLVGPTHLRGRGATDLRRRRRRRRCRGLRAVHDALATAVRHRRDRCRGAARRRSDRRAHLVAARRIVVLHRGRLHDRRTAGAPAVPLVARAGSRHRERVAVDDATHRRARRDRGAGLSAEHHRDSRAACARRAVRVERRPVAVRPRRGRGPARARRRRHDRARHRRALHSVHGIRVALAARVGGLAARGQRIRPRRARPPRSRGRPPGCPTSTDACR